MTVVTVLRDGRHYQSAFYPYENVYHQVLGHMHVRKLRLDGQIAHFVVVTADEPPEVIQAESDR